MDGKTNFEKCSAVALDVAERNQTREHQEALASVIQNLLGKGYQISLFSTKENDDLTQEDYDHPGLKILPGVFPPWEPLLRHRPGLNPEEDLWVTEHAPLQAWLADHGHYYVCITGEEPIRGKGVRLGGLRDLMPLLDPTSRLVDTIALLIAGQRRNQGRLTMQVGIGGPPESGFIDFSLLLKNALESEEIPLVNLFDFSSLLRDSAAVAEESGESGPWRHPEAGVWVMENILKPFSAGERVFLDKLPPQLPREFEPHFPLFLSEETVVLVLGEMLFIPPILNLLDFSILFEISPEETTRRLYEIEPGKSFDSKFTEQYLSREGGVYRKYLEGNQVAAKVKVRVDAAHPTALRLLHVD